MQCEWNPSTSSLALTTDKPHGVATWVTGYGKRTMHICNQCAALKRFLRCKQRRLITTGEVLQNFESRVKQATKTQELCNAGS